MLIMMEKFLSKNGIKDGIIQMYKYQKHNIKFKLLNKNFKFQMHQKQNQNLD